MVTNFIKYAVSEGIAKLAPFITTLYVAKNISVEDFGRYSLIFVIYELFFILISFNIQATTRIDFFKLPRTKFLASKREHFIISFSLALFILIVSIIVGFEFKYILVMLVLSILMRCLSVFQLAVYQCERNASSYVISNLTFTISLSLITIFFVVFGFGYLSWLYGLLFASFLQLLVSCFLFKFTKVKLYLALNRLDFNADSFKSTFIMALLFLPQALGWWLKLGADRWIIESKVGTVTLGEYSLAFQFASVLLIAATVINLVLVPEINTCLKQNNFKRIKMFLYPATIFLAILAFVIYFVAREIVTIFYKVDYLNSIYYLKLLMFPFLVQSLILIVSNILYYFGQGGYMAKIILVTFSLQFLINFFFVDSFAVRGMVLISLFANIIVFLLIILKSKKELALKGF
ncbi:oligosaccharide flippase family protein [Shewanella sp. cp20]|uniref:oligosaccharide flippase family protein n=1 Tax=Shewanella sp. cp20 TaxID=1521167 RepID=UPI00059EDD8F|nr:oligosaccharide flippase family protein [Shewanella sp. cp20]KIO36125.1 hypothetical protein DB48_13095 [Shewanella sp. cp20]